ncbi:MAG: Rrf2 family transcriptional regulator [Gemmatimonadetes bacterium]|nr:Rrf2 family transcriptional regulator [Gemmatimonadota bacterium]
MLSRTSEYALRAVLLLARPTDGRLRAADSIAETLGVPRNYLSKVMNRLTRRGVLESVRGPGGGFRLARRPDEIAVADIVTEFDTRDSLSVCVLSDRACNASSPCEAHECWTRWSDVMRRLLHDTTVAHFLQPAGDCDRAVAPGLNTMNRDDEENVP